MFNNLESKSYLLRLTQKGDSIPFMTQVTFFGIPRVWQ